jgi:peroxiredoxin
LVGFAENKAELDALGIKVAAASVDPLDKAKEVADEVNFPVGYGVTKDLADTLGSWWEPNRQIIQPTELILNADNKVVASSYSDGPLARTQAADVISLVKIYDSRAKK